MSKSTVSLYFNGSREFPINRLEEFARALHTTPEEVLNVRDDEQLTNTAYSLVKKGIVHHVICKSWIICCHNYNNLNSVLFV